jgi:hypothetical protein
MGELILNKIFFIIFIMCSLNVGLHLFEVVKRLRQETPEKYTISKRGRFLLGMSIAFIITSFITGITL